MPNFLQMMTHDTQGPAIFRLAEVMAGSQLIPPHLRGKVDDVFVALAMADQMGENPVVVMQNIYVVSGRAGWSASYMIARANTSGVFCDRIDWRVSGKGDSLSVTASATLAASGQVVSMTADMSMAAAEGWTKNAKYKSMPEVMLRYRSATLLIRMYAGDVMLGMHTADELETLPAEARVEPRERPVPLRSSAARAIADAGRANAEIPTQPAREVIEATATQAEDAPAASADERPAGMRDIQRAIDAGRGLGLNQAHLEAHVSRAMTAWTVADLRMLSELIRETRAGKTAATSADDEGV